MTNITISPNLQQQAEKVFSTLDVREETRNDYSKSIKTFVDWIAVNPLTNNSFLEFKQFLKERTDIGVSSKNKYLISARVLLKELARTGSMPDITQNVKGFKQGKKHKKDGLNDIEVKKVVDALRALPNNFDCLRLKAIVSLFIYQGLRQKEVVGLNVEHINLSNSRAIVTGKGRDDFELIHLHPETVKALSNYMMAIGRSSGALFFGRGSERLRCMSVRRLVTNQLLSLGIFKSTHGFRHFFTTTLVKSFKGDLLQVAQFTRHKSIDMLQVYNDAVLTKESLPQYYDAFAGLNVLTTSSNAPSPPNPTYSPPGYPLL